MRYRPYYLSDVIGKIKIWIPGDFTVEYSNGTDCVYLHNDGKWAGKEFYKLESEDSEGFVMRFAWDNHPEDIYYHKFVVVK